MMTTDDARPATAAERGLDAEALLARVDGMMGMAGHSLPSEGFERELTEKVATGELTEDEAYELAMLERAKHF